MLATVGCLMRAMPKPKPSSRVTEEFERDVLAHLPSLMVSARRLTRSAVDAEDLVQETVIKAIRARAQYRVGTNLRAWLYRIQRNAFITRFNRGSLERATLHAPVADPVSDGWVGSATMRAMRDPESVLLRPELEAELKRAIDELPVEFREVVLLTDVEGFSYREAAETLGCPIGTVMSRLHRGRRQLKGHLIQHAKDRGLVGAETSVGTRNPSVADAHRKQGKQGLANSADPVVLSDYRNKTGSDQQ